MLIIIVANDNMLSELPLKYHFALPLIITNVDRPQGGSMQVRKMHNLPPLGSNYPGNTTVRVYKTSRLGQG